MINFRNYYFHRFIQPCENGTCIAVIRIRVRVGGSIRVRVKLNPNQ